VKLKDNVTQRRLRPQRKKAGNNVFKIGISLARKFICDLKSQDPILRIYIRLGALHNNVMREN